MHPLATKVEVNRWTKKGKPFNRHKTKEQIKLYRFRSLEMLFLSNNTRSAHLVYCNLLNEFCIK